MDLQAEKNKLVELLLKTDDEDVLLKVKRVLLNEQPEDWWDEISEEEKAAIRTGLRQAEKENNLPHVEVAKKFAQWGLK